MKLPQSVHVNGSLSDSSLVSRNGSYPLIKSYEKTVIDCGNYYSTHSDVISSIVDFQQDDSVSTSYVRTVVSGDYGSSNKVTFVYKFSSEYSGKIYFANRIAFTAGFNGCTIKYYYSNYLVHQISLSVSEVEGLGGFNKYYYVHDNFTAFDSDLRDFKIEVYGPGVILDCLIFNSSSVRSIPDIQPYIYTESGSIFSLNNLLDPSISLSPVNLKKFCDISSITLHLQLYTLDKTTDEVNGFLKCHSYVNTNSVNYDNGWISFNINYFYSYSEAEIAYINNNYKIGISVIGCHKNENLYFIWSQSDSEGQTYLLKKDDGLIKSDYDLSVRIYDDAIALSDENYIYTSPPNIENLFVDNFSKQNIIKASNIVYEKDVDGMEYVSLNLPNRIVTFIVDTSGSMTWNDSNGERFEVAKDLINRFSGGYPGGINYQIISFGGTQILTEWFGVVESKIQDTSDANEAKKKAFFDEAFSFNGVQIVRKKGSIPLSPTDGEIVYSGYSKILYDTGLENNSIYYYAIFSQTDDGRFSEPVVIKAIPENRNIPGGVKSLDGKSYKASGVAVDSNIICALHMDESSGKYLYDFSKGSIFEYVKSGDNSAVPIWISRDESPRSSDLNNQGKGSGIRLNGVNEYFYLKDNKIPNTLLNQIGFMVWLYPFSSQSSMLDSEMGIINISLENGDSLRAKLNIDGTLYIYNDSNFCVSTAKIEPNSWNHVAFFVDELSSNIYINGQEESVSFVQNNSFISNIQIGISENGIGFFGKITEFSLHNAKRSYDYVVENYNNILSWNGESIVVLNFKVPNSYINNNIRYSVRYKPELGPLRHLNDDISGPANYGNYAGDTGFRPPNAPPNWSPRPYSFARIAYGDDLGPCSIDDGEEIFNGFIDKSAYTFVVVKNFVSNFDEIEKWSLGGSAPGFRHYFRVFTLNEYDISSLPEDSGLFEYIPPVYRNRLLENASINSVKNVEYYEGDSKIYVKWDLDYDPNVSNVVIYFSRIAHPDILQYRTENDQIGNGEISVSNDFFPVFIGDKNSSNFVFRKGIVEFIKPSSVSPGSGFGTFQRSIGCPECDIINNEKAYISIYTRDKYGNYGVPVKIIAVPGVDKQDDLIPPDQIYGVRYQPVDENSLSIRWMNPAKINSFSDIVCWTDDRIVFYFKATDIFGRKIETNYKFKFTTSRDDNPMVISDGGGYPGQIFPMTWGQGRNDYGWKYFYNESVPRGFSEFLFCETHFDPERAFGPREKIYFSKVSKIQEVANSSDGYSKIFFDLSNASPDQFSLIAQAYFSASITLKVSKNISSNVVAENSDNAVFFDAGDYFEYITTPIRVLMNNPLAVAIHTSSQVLYPNPVNISINSNSICDYSSYGIGGNGSFQETGIQVAGSYVKRDSPYAILLRASYKGRPLSDGFVANVYLYEDVSPPDLPLDPDNRPTERFTSSSVWGEICGAVQYCTQDDPLPPDEFAGSYILSNLGLINNQVEFKPHISGRFSEAVYYLPVPSEPTSVRFIPKIEVENVYSCPQAYLSFVNNLRIRINTRGPISDGKDVAKQICYAYTIDPDFSVNDSNDLGLLEDFIVPLPDFTPVFWELVKYRNARERPFYSISQNQSSNEFIVLADGVYDYLIDGYSQNVFFGPASNVTGQLITVDGSVNFIGEEYVVKATISYQGSSVTALGPACIFPINYNYESDNPETPIIKKTSFLSCIESGDYVDTIYSDGKDFATLIISKDPEISYQESSGVLNNTIGGFLKCYNSELFSDSSGISGAFVSNLATDKPVSVEIVKPNAYHNQSVPYWTNTVNINHGNLIVYEDNGALISEGDFSSQNNGIIRLESSNHTRFSITSNAFIPLIWSRYGDPTTIKDVGILCNHIHNSPNGAAGSINPYVRYLDYDVEIKAKTNSLIDGENIELISAGSWSVGNPPKLIKFVEPLRIDLAYVLVNDVPSNKIRVDGVSTNKLVYVVTFAGRKISIDSPIKIYQCNMDIIKPEQEIKYCEIKNDPFFVGIDVSGNPIPGYIPGEQSFFYVELNVLDPSLPFDGTIFAECNYDESGSVIRQRVLGVKAKYLPSSVFAKSSNDSVAILYSSSSSSSSSGVDLETDDNLHFYANQNFDIYDNQYKFTSSSSSINIPSLEEDVLTTRPTTTTPFSKSCYAYDLSLESQSAVSSWYKIADMAIEKAWHSVEFVDGKAYSLGGVGIGGITSYNECWDPAYNQWVYRNPMPSVRFGMQSCNDGRYIYCIGGVELANIYTSGPSGGTVGGSSSSSSYVYRTAPVVSNKLERYDTVTDTWYTLKNMPVLDINGFDISDTVINDQQSIIKYGVAYGKANLIGDKIIVYSGVNYINPNSYEPTRMNDRILVYSIPDNRWYYSNVIEGENLEKYSRSYPSSFIHNNESIVLFGGTKYVIDSIDVYASGLSGVINTPYSSKNISTDSIKINIDNIVNSLGNFNVVVQDASYLFENIPFPRDQAGTVILNNDVYVLGGRILSNADVPGTSFSRKFERLSYSNFRYGYEKLEKPPMGKSLFGIFTDGVTRIISCGGLSSTVTPGYVQLDIKAYGEQTERNDSDYNSLYEQADAVIRLDGRSYCDLVIYVYDEEGDLIEKSINLDLYGSLKFPDNESDYESSGGFGSFSGNQNSQIRKIKRRGTRVYPVQIDPPSVSTNNGVAFARVMPRTEDPLRTIDEIKSILNVDINQNQAGSQTNFIKIVQNSVRLPYQIIISAQIIDDFYFGNTVFNPDVSSSSSSSEYAFFPELFEPDVNADAGEFEFARSMPAYKVVNTEIDAALPTYFHDSGYMLMTQQVGFIGGAGDSDLFTFTAPKTGSYKISVTRRGFSSIKTKVKLYNFDKREYNLCQASVNDPLVSTLEFKDEFGVPEISFPGCPGSNSALRYELQDRLYLLAGIRYYVEISSLSSDENTQLSERVGEYRLRIGTNIPPEQVDYYVSTYNSASESGTGNSGFTEGLKLKNYFVPPGCIFTCQECVRDDTRWAGLSCIGSDNTYCINVDVDSYVPPPSFRSNFFGNPVPPIDPYVDIPEPQPPIALPEYLRSQFIDLDDGLLASSSGFIPLNVNSSPVIQYYSDFDWIPEIKELLSINNGSYENAINVIKNIKSTTSFGCSPLFDAIDYAVKSYSFENLDPYFPASLQSIYILTDNDENTSSVNPDEVADAINSLNGPDGTPIVVYNFNLFKPSTISNQASLSNAGLIARIIKQTGGEVVNYIDSIYKQEYVDFGIGQSVGGVGYGEYHILISFSEVVWIKNLNHLYETPLYTDILWGIEYSSDGENYIPNDVYYNINNSVSDLDIQSKFIKVKYKFLHTFKDSYIDPYSNRIVAEKPILRKITILFSNPRENLIVLDGVNVGADLQQISVSVVSEDDEFSSIYVGASSRGSSDWNNYFKDSQPFVNNYDKVFIPYRMSDLSGVILEPLIKIDEFSFNAEHGPWMIDSEISVIDSNGDIVDSSKYKAFSSSGAVVFNESVTGSNYKIMIQNNNNCVVAIKCINKNPDKFAKIKSITLFANTNSQREYLSENSKPIAYNLRYLQDVISIYTPISIIYRYADNDGDPEDTTKTLIQWYKNGTLIPELNNQKSINDLNNPDDITYQFVYSQQYWRLQQESGRPAEILALLRGEKLWNVGDSIYFTVTPHDGNQFGNVAISESITIRDIQDRPNYILIRGRLDIGGTALPNSDPGGGSSSGGSNNFVLTNLFNKRATLFADYDIFSFAKMQTATIRWYVNGSIWKSGPLLPAPDFSVFLTYEIKPTEENPLFPDPGKVANTIGNIIEVEIVLADGFTIKSNPIQIVNCIPKISSVELIKILGINPANGATTEILSIGSYTIDDPDIEYNNQTDQTILRWFFSLDDGTNWEYYPRAQPRNVLGPGEHSPGQKWKIIATPYDGFQQGDNVESNIVTINFD